jgi:NAD+ synthase
LKPHAAGTAAGTAAGAPTAAAGAGTMPAPAGTAPENARTMPENAGTMPALESTAAERPAEAARRPDLRLDARLATAVLTGFIRDAVETACSAGVVVGLSGGVDSSLAAALATAALGRERVHGFLLPYRTSSAHSAADARRVAEQLGIDHRLIDLSPMIDAYFALEPGADPVRRGNKMARERMTILYDQAKKLDCLVLGTSNKTEILLGYSTVFGDNASSLNPLGDLYKQQVWQLAEHLGLPPDVVGKQPSADLWPGQTDEGDLGFSYPVADEVLYLLFDRGLRPEEVVERGYDAEVVGRIVSLEQRFRFKRRLMLIARLSGSAINLDHEIPRD